MSNLINNLILYYIIERSREKQSELKFALIVTFIFLYFIFYKSLNSGVLIKYV